MSVLSVRIGQLYFLNLSYIHSWCCRLPSLNCNRSLLLVSIKVWFVPSVMTTPARWQLDFHRVPYLQPDNIVVSTYLDQPLESNVINILEVADNHNQVIVSYYLLNMTQSMIEHIYFFHRRFGVQFIIEFCIILSNC